jgi:hypothetical protein
MRDHAQTLSDFRVPSLSIECEPCGRRGRYNVARLMEQHGDAKLPELLYVLADCPKAKAASVYDRCRARCTARQPLERVRQHGDIICEACEVNQSSMADAQRSLRESTAENASCPGK